MTEQNIGSKYVNIDHPILHPIFHVDVDERSSKRGRRREVVEVAKVISKK